MLSFFSHRVNAHAGFRGRGTWHRMRFMKRFSNLTSRVYWLLAAISLASLGAGDLVEQTDLDQTTRSAIYLLRNSTRWQRDGRPNLMLKALRQIDDPSLSPVFEYLADAEHPLLQITGLLALAQCQPARQIDLNRLVSIQDLGTQAEAIRLAMDMDLLTTDQAQQLVSRPDLDMAVKMQIMPKLVQEGRVSDMTLLETARQDEKAGRRALAAALMLQLGDDEALNELHALSASEVPGRDAIQQVLLNLAIQHEFDRVAPWAGAISENHDASKGLRLQALRVALRFGWPNAAATWHQRFADAQSPADQIRLAIVALWCGRWVQPGLFEPLIAHEIPLLRQIGATGVAFATGDRVGPSIVDLLRQRHPMINNWALSYAQEPHHADEAYTILSGFITIFEPGQADAVVQMNQVAGATQLLYERDATEAGALLRPILTSPDSDDQLIKGILYGLIRCRWSDDPHTVIQSLDPFKSPEARHLALLLMAKHDYPLNDSQMKDLKLLIRGGGGLADALRLQAAWAYLRRTGQVDRAIAAVLN